MGYDILFVGAEVGNFVTDTETDGLTPNTIMFEET